MLVFDLTLDQSAFDGKPVKMTNGTISVCHIECSDFLETYKKTNLLEKSFVDTCVTGCDFKDKDGEPVSLEDIRKELIKPCNEESLNHLLMESMITDDYLALNKGCSNDD